MERHFAYFENVGSGAGRCVREWRGDVADPPDLDPFLPKDQKQIALDRWASAVSAPKAGEIGLDVTPLDIPEGDYVWAVLRQPDMVLEWPDQHTFVEIDPELRLCVYWQSSRPVRPSAHHPVIIDITGSELEAHYRDHGPLFGQFVRGKDGTLGFVPDDDRSGLPAMSTLKVLEAASPDLTPVDVSAVRQAELVPVERSA